MADSRLELSALVVHQWLIEWDDEVTGVRFDVQGGHRRKPDPYFFVFSIPARDLFRLSDIYRRRADQLRARDTSIQRDDDKARTEEIRRFIHGGFPWSTLSEKDKRIDDYNVLRMPGWLPTAIIANILPANATRRGKRIEDHDLVQISQNGRHTALILPSGLMHQNWIPSVPPLEIIDGQHRVLAFNEELNGEYDLPVVAFHDLDTTWQAYLFYTINIKPKRINTSLAYDLYPLLRVQDWLEGAPDGPHVYRETRAQEIVELLWSHLDSPWRSRINMLGQSRSGTITQAAFIRALTSSYLKRASGRGIRIGGLFGAELSLGEHDFLAWNRPQQAAFIILLWQCMQEAVENCSLQWAQSLRAAEGETQQELFGDNVPSQDPAFVSGNSLLATDQGVRGFLLASNDLFFTGATTLRLAEIDWSPDSMTESEDEPGILSQRAVDSAVSSLRDHRVYRFMQSMARDLCEFDWRTASTPGLSRSEQERQMIYRGSGGYRQIRDNSIEILARSPDETVRGIATQLLSSRSLH